MWALDHYSSKFSLKKAWKRLKLRLTALDYSKIDDIEVDGIDTRDYPDFSDAFISYATYKGQPMSDKQLDRLNSDSDFVYNQVERRLY